ncbi:hypothetical protein DFH08DRAFT_840144 [Mycena albidolilacea]|uniref:Uncharacterized protein n=1 Tax=Mycena albidolilacea TaxID=1033008 RepID=A0AAD7AQ06_9AGAR|nr:hypothetical protein DFH08DRAFT_840144 [Mycena albidolilacea]
MQAPCSPPNLFLFHPAQGVAFRQAPSSDSGCPPTDLGGSTLQEGTNNGPLALCLYSNGGHCAYLGGTVQANLSGNDADCPARLISGSDGGSQSGILTLAAPATLAVPASLAVPPTQTSASASPLPSSITSTSPTDTRSLVTPVAPTSQASIASGGTSETASSTTGIGSLSSAAPTVFIKSTSATSHQTEPTNPASAATHRKASLAGGVIAGIAIGTLALILLLGALLFCVRRRHRRILDPVIHVELAAESGPTLPSAASEKTPELNAHLNGMAGQEEISRSTTSPSVPVQLRREYLRNRIGEARRKLLIMNDVVSRSVMDDDVDEEITLEGALRQIQSQQEQIGRLESQLQSQWALGLSDEPPPQYLQ